ncbi:hypothetical protein EMIT0P4_30447 [Pseudomonas sp. IT-P4]
MQNAKQSDNRLTVRLSNILLPGYLYSLPPKRSQPAAAPTDLHIPLQELPQAAIFYCYTTISNRNQVASA